MGHRLGQSSDLFQLLATSLHVDASSLPVYPQTLAGSVLSGLQVHVHAASAELWLDCSLLSQEALFDCSALLVTLPRGPCCKLVKMKQMT